MSEKEMSPAEREARQMIADKKMQKATERAYEKARRTGPEDDEPNGAGVKKLGRMLDQMRRPAPEPTVDQMGNQTGMAKGGKVSSASKRADGCATKGKTKGTMVKMAMGGKSC
jgi:hypothetical protein